MTSATNFLAGTAVVAAAAIALLQPLADPAASTVLAITVLVIGLWATGVVAEHFTAVLFFAVAMLTGVAPAETVFAGFASSAFWLVFAGLVIGLAVDGTGLGRRMAARLARGFGTSYAAVISGIVAFALVLVFVMPSAMGRVVLMAPILVALAGRLGYGPGSRGRSGIVLAGILGTVLPAFAVLPANVPNMVLAGTMEALWSVAPAYGSYLLLHFPLLGIAKSVLLVPVILWFHSGEGPAAPVDDEIAGPMTPGEKWLAVILVGALALWATDTWHGISAAWIGLGAAVLCLAPFPGLVPAGDFRKVNPAPLFYVAGVIGLGAVVGGSGLGTLAAGAMNAALPLEPGAGGWNFGVLAAMSTLTALLTTLPGVPAVMTPMAGDLAAASGLPIMAVLMTQVLGFSSVLLPYQTPPTMVGLQAAGIRAAEAARLYLVLAAVTVAVLLPLDFLWWRFLGVMP